MRIGFVGFGLVGGSIARALRARGDAGERLELVAWSPSGTGPGSAVADGILDAVAPDPDGAIRDSTMVVLAGPADAVLRQVERLGRDGRGLLLPDATVTDVASTKRRIVAAADGASLAFVGGHPMAGRESAGYGASDAGMLTGRPWVVTPGAHARGLDVERVEWLVRAVGAEPVRATPDEHDAAVAAVSHLPLVVAAALAESVATADRWRESLAHELAASGWHSATRLARGDPAMGAGILATNAEATAERLRAYRAVLDEWLALLEAGSGAGADVDALRRRLGAARRAVEA